MEKISGFKLGKSRNGKGVFTTKHFKKNSRLFEIKGEVITCNIEDDIDEEIRLNTYRLGEEDFINPKGYFGFFVNHSCKPNSKIEKIKGRLYITSLRDIKRGEEVFFDYTTNSAVDDIWEMKCNCGEKECRGLLGNIKTLSKNLRKEYVRLNIIPKYILDIK